MKTRDGKQKVSGNLTFHPDLCYNLTAKGKRGNRREPNVEIEYRILLVSPQLTRKSRLHIGILTSAILTFVTTSGSMAYDGHEPVNLSGWHTDGQTFLVWEHYTSGYPNNHIYQIYASPEPIHFIDEAILVGEVLSNNCWNFRLQDYLPDPDDARWVLPNGSTNGYKVGPRESYFVATPHESGERYYAVVGKGSHIVDLSNTTGPIYETIDPVHCHIQYRDEDVTIYAHWIDGNSDAGSGRVDYPVMGNEYANGLGFNFAVWEPKGGRPPGRLPAVIRLHGIMGSLLQDNVIEIATSLVPDGLFVTLDDVLRCGPFPGTDITTAWFGYADEFNRFSPPDDPPSESAIIMNYTARRIWWETDWLIKNESIDAQRISLTGNSLGGSGAILHTTLKPETYASGMATVPELIFGPWDPFYPIFGTAGQNLLTNLEGSPPLWNLFNTSWRVQQPHPDWPYVLLVNGTSEDSWRDRTSPCFEELDAARTGYALYWDEREHGNWEGAHFNPSEHLSESYLTRFSKDQSFPAFSSTDERPRLYGRQPDIGEGNSSSSEPWGTWGGYFEWRPSTIVDDPTGWRCTIWITSESRYENDIPDTYTILASVTPRKLQNFKPEAGQFYQYKLVDIASGEINQRGIVQAEEDGTITVDALLLSKDPYRLAIDTFTD